MIDTVIFDVGNVLVKVENESIQRDISNTLGINIEKVKFAWDILIPEYLSKGKILEKDFWERFLEITNPSKKGSVPKDLISRQLCKRFTIFPEVLEIVKTLKQNGYKLGIISDTIKSHANEVRKHKIFDYFDEVILSYQVGLRKSDPKIFKLAINRLHSKPQNTVFIDDIPKYVRVSKTLGINGIIFKNPKQLKDSLKKLGIEFRRKKGKNNAGAFALIITKDKKIILQQRTHAEYIKNPGKIGMFGGSFMAGESPIKALKREIFEELNLKVKDKMIKKLGTFYKTKKIDGEDYIAHTFLLSGIELEKLKLNEWDRIVVGDVKGLLRRKKLTRITRQALKTYSNS